jgi:hypothetical protein
MQSRPSFSEYRHSRSQSSFGVEAQCRPQLAKQRLRVFQIARVEPFRKPGHRSKQFARLLRLALVTPETRKLEDQSSWQSATHRILNAYLSVAPRECLLALNALIEFLIWPRPVTPLTSRGCRPLDIDGICGPAMGQVLGKPSCYRGPPSNPRAHRALALRTVPETQAFPRLDLLPSSPRLPSVRGLFVTSPLLKRLDIGDYCSPSSARFTSRFVPER